MDLPANVSACLQKVSKILSEDLRTNPRDLAPYSKDHSYHHPVQPWAVARVCSEAQISQILATCSQHSVPIVPFAAGSSLEGHVIPSELHRGIVLDVSGMDKVVKVYAEDLAVVVEPGVGWMELNKELKKYGLFFPNDPGAAACVGGMCATNCSGTLAWKYGTMKDNVLGLRVVLADGRVITTRKRVTKSSAGYDLTRLLIGSEGTLGIITQATLRLRRLPLTSTVALAQFPSLDTACSYVSSIVLRSPASLTRIELMDDICVKAANLANNESWPEHHTLLLEFSGDSLSTLEKDSQFCEALACTHHSATAYTFGGRSEREIERIWTIRKKIFFAIKYLRPDRPGTAVLTTDVAVPISRLRDILHYTSDLIASMGLVAPLVAHAGDGNFHAVVLVDRNDPMEVQKVEQFRLLMARKAIEMDGTVTGEHGIGKGKRDLLIEELGETAVEVMREIKKALDPKGILNPEKVFKLAAKSPSTPPGYQHPHEKSNGKAKL
ncbi:hypothetical protein HK102_007619 [Quaeritorhiza haematococci]|nr:hypothetical protein HK102_007619 [Quaeritorhiza haematococci]